MWVGDMAKNDQQGFVSPISKWKNCLGRSETSFTFTLFSFKNKL